MTYSDYVVQEFCVYFESKKRSRIALNGSGELSFLKDYGADDESVNCYFEL